MSEVPALPDHLAASVARLHGQVPEVRAALDRIILWASEAQHIMRDVHALPIFGDGDDYDWPLAEDLGLVDIIELRGDISELSWAKDA